MTSEAERRKDGEKRFARFVRPGWLDCEIGAALILGAVFAAPFLIAPLTYPPYYEDESWVFVPAFELLRGQGASVGALGFDQHPFPLFYMVVAPLLALSPLGPEMTIRGVALLAGLAALWGCFAVARAVDRRAGTLACAIFLCTPLLFHNLRYGRTDALALAFALWSTASALSRRPCLAGGLAACAICTHPLMVWLIPFGLWLAYRAEKWNGALRFFVPLVIVGALQVGWVTLNRDTAFVYLKQFSITATGYGATSVGSALIASFLHESDRYSAYLRSLPVWDWVIQFFTVIGGVIAGAWRSVRERQWALVAGLLGIAATVSLLVGTKSSFHLIFVLAFACALAGYGVSKLPRNATVGLSVALILLASLRYSSEAWATRQNINISKQMEAIDHATPSKAIVFGQLLYAGLAFRRPDIRYFSYHALTPNGQWRFPSCSEMDRRITEIVKSDRRTVNGESGAHTEVSEVYILTPSYDTRGYLGSIYNDLPEASVACLINGESITLDQRLMCGSNGCSISALIRRSVLPPSK